MPKYYLAIKKRKIFPLATTWIDLENVISEVSQRQILYDFTYM